MNANLPQLDLPRDYVVGNDITEAILNFYKQTCRLKAGIFALCVEGNLRASINLTEYTLKPNDFITLMPGSIIQFCEQKESFRLSFIGFSSEFMDCVNMIKSTMSALPTIYENPIISLSEDRADFINDYFHLLERVQAKEKSINREMVKHILLTMIHGISDLYQGKSWPNKITTRSDEIHKKIHPTGDEELYLKAANSFLCQPTKYFSPAPLHDHQAKDRTFRIRYHSRYDNHGRKIAIDGYGLDYPRDILLLELPEC